ncbi:unnamed protein product [Schistocephalus solidus]|uniref:C2H2-type domain-containing protein n=1 Tax=Schistocephalus solidus TaxID=70667 RepID=A0A183T9A6_SCHSO|nr:unnamed protein product [Schistocephalus solidus]
MIFAALQVEEKFQEMRTHLHITFVDLTQASITMNRDGLRKIMQKFGCLEVFMHTILQHHDGIMAHATDNGTNFPHVRPGLIEHLRSPCTNNLPSLIASAPTPASTTLVTGDENPSAALPLNTAIPSTAPAGATATSTSISPVTGDTNRDAQSPTTLTNTNDVHLVHSCPQCHRKLTSCRSIAQRLGNHCLEHHHTIETVGSTTFTII